MTDDGRWMMDDGCTMMSDGMTGDTRVKKVSQTSVQFRISRFGAFIRLLYIIYIYTVRSVTSVIA